MSGVLRVPRGGADLFPRAPGSPPPLVAWIPRSLMGFESMRGLFHGVARFFGLCRVLVTLASHVAVLGVASPQLHSVFQLTLVTVLFLVRASGFLE
ncbi:hypothetical protein NL676_015069 [Syzygium grande]|nr:hypothetical protein NL676_015069 [Syzygium grande]